MAVERILLGHGGGGSLTRELIEKHIGPILEMGGALDSDSAVLDSEGARIAFTTDSYVVRPPFFPGGDIGRLAVCGTVNDLATSGARPVALSLGLILEEGLPREELERVLVSVAAAAKEAGVRIVTGDTKVVDRGAADKIFINTSGVGFLDREPLHPSRIAEGDVIVVSGNLGEHGIAILGLREGLELGEQVRSDVAPLGHLVRGALQEGYALHAARDLTRGGLAAAMVEMADAARLSFLLHEEEIPVSETVKGACELLGLDPLTVANEGKMAFFLPAAQATAFVGWLRGQRYAENAVVVGSVERRGRFSVVLQTAIGGARVVTMPMGELLPRIC